VTDLSEFFKQRREELLNAIAASGVPRENLVEVVPKKDPGGRWNKPVIIFDKVSRQPVAQYHLTFPKTSDGQRTVKFNIATFESVLKHVNQATNP
jgi:hypothetical protein